MPELRVGEHAPLAAFVQVDERRAAAIARFDVPIDRVVREVGFGADEPLEGRRRPVEDLVPRPEPWKLARRFLPERVGITPRVPVTRATVEISARGDKASFVFVWTKVGKDWKLVDIPDDDSDDTSEDCLEKL